MNERQSRLEEQCEKIPESGCWIWMGALHPDGYGYSSRHQLAHRTSWTVFKGIIPKPMCVLHRCDVPSCINPEHLFIGTHQDNMKDRDKKGRQYNRHGEANGRATITLKEAWQMRDLYRTGRASQKELTDLYGISRFIVSNVLNHSTWTQENPYESANRS